MGNWAEVEYKRLGSTKVSLLEDDSKQVIPPTQQKTEHYSIYEWGTILSLVKSEINDDPQPLNIV